ncbi:hypothetical protein ANO11243_092340 [Dothideomycetidae sp. 11243]|nr:hypothetical protein ANO11243_092340 [fungal sp. No.11243]
MLLPEIRREIFEYVALDVDVLARASMVSKAWHLDCQELQLREKAWTLRDLSTIDQSDRQRLASRFRHFDLSGHEGCEEQLGKAFNDEELEYPNLRSLRFDPAHDRRWLTGYATKLLTSPNLRALVFSTAAAPLIPWEQWTRECTQLEEVAIGSVVIPSWAPRHAYDLEFEDFLRHNPGLASVVVEQKPRNYKILGVRSIAYLASATVLRVLHLLGDWSEDGWLREALATVHYPFFALEELVLRGSCETVACISQGYARRGWSKLRRLDLTLRDYSEDLFKNISTLVNLTYLSVSLEPWHVNREIIEVRADHITSLAVLQDLRCLEVRAPEFNRRLRMVPSWDADDQELFLLSFAKLERLSLTTDCTISESAMLILARVSSELRYCRINAILNLSLLGKARHRLFPNLEHLHMRAPSESTDIPDTRYAMSLNYHMPKLESLFLQCGGHQMPDLSDALSQTRNQTWTGCRCPEPHSSLPIPLHGIALAIHTSLTGRPINVGEPKYYKEPMHLGRARFLAQSEYMRSDWGHGAASE